MGEGCARSPGVSSRFSAGLLHTACPPSLTSGEAGSVADHEGVPRPSEGSADFCLCDPRRTGAHEGQLCPNVGFQSCLGAPRFPSHSALGQPVWRAPFSSRLFFPVSTHGWLLARTLPHLTRVFSHFRVSSWTSFRVACTVSRISPLRSCVVYAKFASHSFVLSWSRVDEAL